MMDNLYRLVLVGGLLATGCVVHQEVGDNVDGGADGSDGAESGSSGDGAEETGPGGPGETDGPGEESDGTGDDAPVDPGACPPMPDDTTCAGDCAPWGDVAWTIEPGLTAGIATIATRADGVAAVTVEALGMGQVYWIEADGTVAWTAPVVGFDTITTFDSAGDLVVVSVPEDPGTRVTKYDESGAELWSIELDDRAYGTPLIPTPDGGVMFETGEIVELDADGSVVNTIAVPQQPGVNGLLLLDGGDVLITTERLEGGNGGEEVYVTMRLTADGTVVWENDLAAHAIAPGPCDTFYAILATEEVAQIDESGAVLWSHELPGLAHLSTLQRDGDEVFAGGRDGGMFQIRRFSLNGAQLHDPVAFAVDGITFPTFSVVPGGDVVAVTPPEIGADDGKVRRLAR